MKTETDSSISKFKRFKIRLKKATSNFSITEKIIFFSFLLILIFSVFSSLLKVNATFMVQVPQKGGELKEGLIGTPRFINPVIAISETDRDISSLIYSGILKVNSQGELINDLADSFSVSEDGLTYSVKIRDDAFFHNGTEVTTDDLIFTIQKTQDPAIKSPKRPNFDGVVIEKIDNKNIEFILSEPYSPFAYNLTLGILPKNIWEKISTEEFAFSKYNLEPVGSGPYLVKNIKSDRDGIIKKYELKSFKNHALGEPYIEKIIFNFYKNENDLIQDLNNGEITSAHSISPNKISEINLERKELIKSPFSRIFALYLNQNNNEIFTSQSIRNALNAAAPKTQIKEDILKNYARTIQSPLIRQGELSNEQTASSENPISILEKDGWQKNEDGIFAKDDKLLKFSISTANVLELVEVSELLASKYRELGIDIEVKIFEPNDLTLNVIRPRNFESIFFGQVINRDKDYYAFWHSSQRNDPGLNISGYTNINVDKALENFRSSSDSNTQTEALQIFEKEVINDAPAIFLYSPDFIYIVSDKLNLEKPTSIVTSSDRFNDIEKWYIETDLIWKIFAK